MTRQIVLILCLIQWSGAALAGGTALFREGFEDPKASQWQHAWGTWELSTERAREGKRSLKEILEDKYGYSVHHRDVKAERGARYTFSAWVYIPSDQPKRPVALLSINTTRWSALASAETAKLDQWVQLAATHVNSRHRDLRFELMQARQTAGLGGAVMFWDSVVCTIEPGAVPVKEPQHPSPDVLEGLGIAPAGGLGIEVAPGACMVDRNEVAAKAATFQLDPPATRTVANERCKLGAEAPGGWSKGTRLRQIIGAGVTLPGCLTPGSVVVKPSPDGKPLERGKDYLLDETWGTMGRVEGGGIGAEAEVCIDYAYSLMRLDTVQVSPTGEVSVQKGVDAKTCPHPAGALGGCLALANVFVSYNARELAPSDIYPIGPPLPPPTHEELAKKASRVPKARRKLQEGGTLRIGFWGDSVTCGGDASRPERRFPDGFVLELRRKYPKPTIEFFNAGIGGSNTRGRLPNLHKDVIEKQPDLVAIEFVNDMGFPPEVMREHYHKAIEQVRAIGGEVILITPHFTMPSMMGFKNLWDTDRRAACQALREIADEEQVGLADAARAWQHLCRTGLPYTTLLYNGINHPDDRGHRIFIDELMKFF